METFNDQWFNNKTKEEVVKEISELRRNIKKKHRALKREIFENEELFEKQLKPIAEPLKKLVEEGVQQQVNQRKRKLPEETVIPVKRYIEAPPQGVKRKQKLNLPTYPEYESDYEYDDGNAELPVPKRLAMPNINMETEDEGREAETEEMIAEPITPPPPQPVIYESQPTGQDFIKTPEGRNLAKDYIQKHFKGRIAKEYFLKLIKGAKDVDHNYGVRVEGDYWMIGDKHLDIDVDDLIIDGTRYTGTRGLYELIFMNIPNEYMYDEADLNNYANILKETNVHRVNYSALGKLKSNRGSKYKNIISHIITRDVTREPMTTYPDLMNQAAAASGSGLFLTDAKPNIVYYDDPNELVDRLRILLGSQQAGNTGHTNEINSIMEELHELDRDLIK